MNVIVVTVIGVDPEAVNPPVALFADTAADEAPVLSRT